MSVKKFAEKAMEQGHGILRLAPTWVPRSFLIPGCRLKLHPDDYYVLGNQRGGISERWFSSTTLAVNGPLTAPNEGLSFIVLEDGSESKKILLRDAVEELKGSLVGRTLWDKFGSWPMYSKFFDNKYALPHHIHHREEHAKLTGQLGKPEAYFFPSQVNDYSGEFPHTFFGLNPRTTKDQVRQCLLNFGKGDNKITNLSRAYRLERGTGWDVPPGLLHAPGSLCTYEPQRASDVYAMYESIYGNQIVSEELLWKDTPSDRIGDFDYLLEVIDWDLNVDPNFASNRFMEPRPVRAVSEMEADGYIENWIVYKSEHFSAKELTILPGHTAKIKDNSAYGMIMMQGHGKMGLWDIETPAMIRFGQLTHDEYFVSAQAAKAGVEITNPSMTDPIVMLKHFGPENPDLNLL